MAFIGLRNPVAARIKTIEDGQPPEYYSGIVLGRLIQANVNRSHNQNPLYADDVIDEDDNSLTGVTLSVGVNDLEDQERIRIFGDQTASGGDGYDEGADSAPPVGFGYIRVRQKGGVTYYQANWFWKVLFSEDNEESQTKGDGIEWKTPTITGRAHGIYADDSGRPKFRRRKTFTTYEEAVQWLESISNACIKNAIIGTFGFVSPDFTLKQVRSVPPKTSMSDDFTGWPTESQVADIADEGFDPHVYNYTAVINTDAGESETDVNLMVAGGSAINFTNGLKNSGSRYYVKWAASGSSTAIFFIRVDTSWETKYYTFRFFHNYNA